MEGRNRGERWKENTVMLINYYCFVFSGKQKREGGRGADKWRLDGSEIWREKREREDGSEIDRERDRGWGRLKQSGF